VAPKLIARAVAAAPDAVDYGDLREIAIRGRAAPIRVQGVETTG